MKDNQNEPKKGMDTTADDDTLGENTEKTPLTEEVEKDRDADSKDASENKS